MNDLKEQIRSTSSQQRDKREAAYDKEIQEGTQVCHQGNKTGRSIYCASPTQRTNGQVCFIKNIF